MKLLKGIKLPDNNTHGTRILKSSDYVLKHRESLE